MGSWIILVVVSKLIVFEVGSSRMKPFVSLSSARLILPPCMLIHNRLTRYVIMMMV